MHPLWNLIPAIFCAAILVAASISAAPVFNWVVIAWTIGAPS